jgi:hypothetical protein
MSDHGQHERPRPRRRARDHRRYGTRSARAYATMVTAPSSQVLSAPSTSFLAVTSTTRSHSWWTDKRGPPTIPSSSASFCSSTFHRRVRLELLPPPSAVIVSLVACG